eukprot:CAMPEP_0201899532 /NCGR_PEP_ID=MMETSP0902-20130614/50596_1 /ASSEMBLY_ACC=CAM_ASM_000551 /TAXON_ID=420261 /ORGANISM="Thalassiosira antarctica, Strain CCMP982" /LENGTH=57 /DNA_ID=CAMNT_0048432961 /DNA_START=122 /DNA_END=292 /DNA_ORIENTATION=-
MVSIRNAWMEAKHMGQGSSVLYSRELGGKRQFCRFFAPRRRAISSAWAEASMFVSTR